MLDDEEEEEDDARTSPVILEDKFIFAVMVKYVASDVTLAECFA